MPKLYDLEIDLSSGNGGLSRTAFKDWMRIRLFGHHKDVTLVAPAIVGSAFVKNDGLGDVRVIRGLAAPLTVYRGSCVHIMFNADDVWKVEG